MWGSPPEEGKQQHRRLHLKKNIFPSSSDLVPFLTSKEEPCARCLHHDNSSGTLVGLRKVPAARSDKAVGSAEREEREVTARESRSIARKLSAPELGRWRSTQAPEPYFEAFPPEPREKPGWCQGMLLVPAWALWYPAQRCCGAHVGPMAQGCSRDGDSTAVAGLSPAGPFWGGRLCPLVAPS